uniref:SH3 domain-containing protein n=1 Tax=Romanomermis culicivorax TaxID=13658 RepID=A0A915HG22_ROMCU
MQDFVAKCDFKGIKPEDLPFVAKEKLKLIATRTDGWWFVENGEKKQGLVPSTFLDADESHVSRLLTGYTECSLFKLLQQNAMVIMSKFLDPRLSIEFHLLPKLNKTGLGFHDLYWNLEKDRIRKRRVKFLKIFSLIKCEQMFIAADNPKIRNDQNLQIIAGFVDFCLFDDHRKIVVSNIHSVKAILPAGNAADSWSFSKKAIHETLCEEYPTFVVRSNFADSNVKLLFESRLQCLLKQHFIHISCENVLHKVRLTYKLFQIEFGHPLQSAMCYSRPCATVGYPVQSASRYGRSAATVGQTAQSATRYTTLRISM